MQVQLCEIVPARNGARFKEYVVMAVKLNEEQKAILRIALQHLEQSQKRSISKYASTGRQKMVDALEQERAKIGGLLAVVAEL